MWKISSQFISFTVSVNSTPIFCVLSLLKKKEQNSSVFLYIDVASAGHQGIYRPTIYLFIFLCGTFGILASFYPLVPLVVQWFAQLLVYSSWRHKSTLGLRQESHSV